MQMGRSIRGCHATILEPIGAEEKILLVGSPNVGKSVIFGHLTGRYVTVSNYPGTTVEVTKGKGKIRQKEVCVIDTPGMYSLVPITEEERVARDILLKERPEVVVRVTAAKNWSMMLHLTPPLTVPNVTVRLDRNPT